jgi:hypothetical protein
MWRKPYIKIHHSYADILVTIKLLSLLITNVFSMRVPNISRLTVTLFEIINAEADCHCLYSPRWSAGWYSHEAISSCLFSAIVFQAKHVLSVWSTMRGSVKGYSCFFFFFKYTCYLIIAKNNSWNLVISLLYIYIYIYVLRCGVGLIDWSQNLFSNLISLLLPTLLTVIFYVFTTQLKTNNTLICNFLYFPNYAQYQQKKKW